ncbi:hypothetical protein LCGC14_2707150 [marine sediment metagenome]|uniref:Uncharacterized protein n=1 Tax=marine sediment metagenome TaxID=412755 RepID=A0A0F9BN30_9ZZZZ
MENKSNEEVIGIRRCDLHSVLAMLALGKEETINSAWQSIEVMLKR